MNASKLETCAAYLHGRIEAQLEAFAASLNIPSYELTNRVATLLLVSPQGRVEDPMPDMRRETTKARNSIRKVAVARRARKSRSQKVGKGGYWKSMTPAQRGAEMQRRMNMRKAA